MALTNIPFTLVSFILPVILAAVGSAYSIHVLNEYYELAEGKLPKRETVVRTVTAMYSPVTMTGLTTGAGFLSLISAFLIPERHFGIFAAIDVMSAVVLSLTLVPAILSLLALQRRKARPKFLSFLAPVTTSLFRSFSRLIVSRGKLVLAIFFALLLLFIGGASLLEINTSYTAIIGANSSLTRGLDSMDDNFAGSQQLLVEIDTRARNGLQNPEVLKKMDGFQQWLKTKEGLQINKTISLVEIVKELNQKFHGDDSSYYWIPDS